MSQVNHYAAYMIDYVWQNPVLGQAESVNQNKVCVMNSMLNFVQTLLSSLCMNL